MIAKLGSVVQANWYRLYWVGLPLFVAAFATIVADEAVENVFRLNAIEQESSVRLRQIFVPEPNPAIVLVVFTDATKRRLKLWEDGSLSRDNYATLITKLRDAGAKALLVDVVFGQPKPDDDRALKNALKNRGALGITLASVKRVAPEFDDREPDGLRWEYVDLSHLGVGDEDGLRGAANTPLAPDLFAIGAVLYRFGREERRWIQHVALSSVLQFRGISASEIRFDSAFHWLAAGGLEWQLQGNDAVLIQWTQKASPFRTHELSEVLLKYTDAELRRAFRGKLVLVGTVEPGIDVAETVRGTLNGVEFLAQVVNTLLLSPGERPRDIAIFWRTFWSLLLATMACLAAMAPRILLSFAGLGLAAALMLLTPEFIARTLHIGMEVVAPALAILTAFAIGTAMHIWLPKPGRPEGSEFEATAMFIDLRGSTELMQKLGQQRYRRLYMALSGKIAQIVLRFGGYVERTTGDGALVVFPASQSPRHAVSAARATRPISEAITELGRNHDVPLSVTFGMESGVLTGGYVWEGGRRAWSSSGSAVNLARRMQEATDALHIDAAIGPVAARLMEGQIAVEPAGEVAAQGFDGMTKVCKLKIGEDPT